MGIVVGQATSKLANRYIEKGKKEEFLLLLQNLNNRAEEQKTTYLEIANRLGITENAVKQRMRLFKDRFRKGFRVVVSDTVSPEEVDEEIDFLMQVLGK